MLNGYKTYIGVAIIFVAGGLLALKIIDQSQFEIIVSLGGAVGLYGLRKAL